MASLAVANTVVERLCEMEIFGQAIRFETTLGGELPKQIFSRGLAWFWVVHGSITQKTLARARENGC